MAFFSKLATMPESIIMGQAFRITRLPKLHLTLKVKFEVNEVRLFSFFYFVLYFHLTFGMKM